LRIAVLAIELQGLGNFDFDGELTGFSLDEAEIILDEARESATGDDPKTGNRIPPYDGEKALQEIAATRLLLVSAIASAVTPIVRIVAAISVRVGRFATLIRTPKDCGMVRVYEYPSRFSADRRFLGLHCCTWRSPTPGQAAQRPFFALPIGGRH
jgi:hypothetical protein